MTRIWMMVFLVTLSLNSYAQNSDLLLIPNKTLRYSSNVSQAVPKDESNRIGGQVEIEIRRTLHEDAYNGEGSTAPIYKYQSLKINDNTGLLIWIGQSKYGYSRLYASIQSLGTSKVNSTIMIAEKIGDVGDHYLMESKIIQIKNKVIISIHTQYKTDDISEGYFETGEYKIHKDQIEIYQIRNNKFTLIRSINGLK